MSLKSTKFSLIVLGAVAVAFSQAVFSLFNDPEGPNLLVTTGLAVVLYIISLILTRPFSGTKRLLIAVLVQGAVATCIYLLLK